MLRTTLLLSLGLSACATASLSPTARRLAVSSPATLPVIEAVNAAAMQSAGTEMAMQCLAAGAEAAEAERTFVEETPEARAEAAAALVDHSARACVVACDDASEHRSVSEGQRSIVQRYRSACLSQLSPAYQDTLTVERELAAARQAASRRQWLVAHGHLSHIEAFLVRHPVVRVSEYRAQVGSIRTYYAPGLRWAELYLTDPQTQKMRRRFEQLERAESELLAELGRGRDREHLECWSLGQARCEQWAARQTQLEERLGQVQSELASLHNERSAQQQLVMQAAATF